MDYRKICADELRRLNQMRTASKIIKDRILELEGKMKSVGGGSGGTAPNRGGGNKTEEKWLNLIVSVGEEKKRLREVLREIKRIEVGLDAIAEEERKILIAAYVEGEDMRDIAEREHISRATAYRLRDEAIISFARATYGTVVT